MTLKPSPEEWAEWLANPVTQWARQVVGDLIRRDKQAALAAYWAGQPRPEADRLALARLAAWHEDFFEATHEDLTMTEEANHEWKRHQAG